LNISPSPEIISKGKGIKADSQKRILLFELKILNTFGSLLVAEGVSKLDL
jgi:hypothetical protein